MGLQSSRQFTSLKRSLNPGERWTTIAKQPNKNILKSTEGMLADEYIFNVGQFFSVKQQLRIYEDRRKQNLPVVRVIAAEILQTPSSSGLCSGEIESHGRVLTQRIKSVIADAPQMNFPEAIYCMSEALIGFRNLYQIFGPFEITNRMIGLTPQGFVKVWMNQNFALNHPLISMLSPFTTTNNIPNENMQVRLEVQMVKDLFKVVEYHTENGKFPGNWSLQIKNQRDQTFIEARNFLQKFVIKNNVYLPDRISEGKMIRIMRGPAEKQIKQTGGQLFEYTKMIPQIVQSKPLMIKPQSAILSRRPLQTTAPVPQTSFTKVTTPVPQPTQQNSSTKIIKPQNPQVIVNSPMQNMYTSQPQIQFTHSQPQMMRISEMSFPSIQVNSPPISSPPLLQHFPQTHQSIYQNQQNKLFGSIKTISQKNENLQASSNIKSSSKIGSSSKLYGQLSSKTGFLQQSQALFPHSLSKQFTKTESVVVMGQK